MIECVPYREHKPAIGSVRAGQLPLKLFNNSHFKFYIQKNFNILLLKNKDGAKSVRVVLIRRRSVLSVETSKGLGSRLGDELTQSRVVSKSYEIGRNVKGRKASYANQACIA